MGKSGVLEHKSVNISETRKDKGKVTVLWSKGSVGVSRDEGEYPHTPNISGN